MDHEWYGSVNRLKDLTEDILAFAFLQSGFPRCLPDVHCQEMCNLIIEINYTRIGLHL